MILLREKTTIKVVAMKLQQLRLHPLEVKMTVKVIGGKRERLGLQEKKNLEL